jgi:pyridinium-3,5-biscarboxylic acid mononucleotide synthase
MFDERTIRDLLSRVARGDKSVDDALLSLRGLPFEDAGFARLDHHRAIRQGFAEVVSAPAKRLSRWVKSSPAFVPVTIECSALAPIAPSSMQ